jgi:hypothetical protein
VRLPTVDRAVSSALQPDNKLVVLDASEFGSRLLRLNLGGSSTLTMLRSNGASFVKGDPVTLTATVTPNVGPAGAMRFLEDGSPIPGCDNAPLLHSVATCTYVPTTAGPHATRAEYSPSAAIGPLSGSLDVSLVVSDVGTMSAVEFYHGAYNHFFVTTSGTEAALLDAGTPSGWRRTGQVFPVSPLGTAGMSDVCRFWTGQTFAPTSSHFYTPYASECALVRANPDWTYEGTVFALGLTDAAGQCPSGTGPLYRYYNNGQGGAPNHRYTTTTGVDMTIDMSTRGWIAEGNGPGNTFACVPAP